MKRALTLPGLLLLFTYAFTQVPPIKWQHCYGGPGVDFGHGGSPTSDGGYIAMGVADSVGGQITSLHGNKDIWVVKTDSSGSLEWQVSLGGSGAENGGGHAGIQQTSDGGYILTGYSGSNNGNLTTNHGNYDYWVVKLNSTGGIQWQKSLGGSLNDEATSVHQTPDGGYIVGGLSFSTNGDVTGSHGGGEGWIVKLNSVGTIEWQKSVGGTLFDELMDVKPVSTGGYIAIGLANSSDGDAVGNNGGADLWVLKLDSVGGITWQQTYGGDSAEFGYDIVQTTDGGYAATGFERSGNSGDVWGHHPWSVNPYIEDLWVIKITSTGTLQWQKCLGGTAQDWGNQLVQTLDGGYVVVGTSTSVDGDRASAHHWGMYEAWIVKLRPNGVLDWEESLGGSGIDQYDYDQASSIHQLADGGFMVAGVTHSTDGDVSGNHGNFDYSVYHLYPAPPPCILFNISNTGFDCTRWSDTTTLTLLHGSVDSISWGDGIAYKNYNLPLTHVYAQPGYYTISLYDSTGCHRTEYDTLINQGIQLDTASYIHPTCNHIVTGQIAITATGGTPPYSYVWNTGAHTSTITNLPGGDYGISVTDNAGCLSVMHYNLYEISTDTNYFVHLAVTNPNCINNGIVRAEVHSGTFPFSYIWNNTHNTESLTGVGQGYYAVTVTDAAGCMVSGNVFVQADCYNTIKGHIYIDDNGNCQPDGSEPAMPGVALTASGDHSTYYGWAHTNGDYMIVMHDTGTYTLSADYSHYGPCGSSLCPALSPVSFPTLGDTSSNNNIGLHFSGYDLHMCNNWGRIPPCLGMGFWQEWYCINVYNSSPIDAGPITITFKYDSMLMPWIFNRQPTSINHTTRTITWVLDSTNNTGQNNGTIIAQMNFISPWNTTQLETEFWVSPTANDCDISNNHFYTQTGLFGSHDPNYKTVEPEGDITESDTVLTYTVHFQNNGTDTAWFIAVKDTLSPYLNAASVRTIASSPMYTTFNLSENGILEWTFNPAMLPDSLVNEPGSQGFVMFQVKKKKDLPIGTVISNKASIYFDYNPPVVTNTVSNMLVNPQSITPVMRDGVWVTAYPNPFSSETNIVVNGITGGYELELYDATGRMLRTFKSMAGSILQIKREELAAGMYLYSVNTGEKKKAFGKLVVE